MSQPSLPLALGLIKPRSGVPYSSVLRTEGYSPIRSIMGILVAISSYILFVPLLNVVLLQVCWLFRGQPDRATYMAAASAYQLPEGLAVGLVSLALLTPIAMLVYRYAHGMRAAWLISVQPGWRWRYLIGCLLIAVVVLNGIMWLSMIGQPSGFGAPQANWVWFLLATLLLAPLQALAEEIFFRGYLFQAIGSLSANKWVAVVFSALLFAYFHGIQNMALFTDRFAFGLLAGWLVLVTGGLEAGIAAHVVNNLFAFGYAVFAGGVAQAKAIRALTWTQTAWDVVGFGLFAVLAWLFGRRMRVATVTP